LNNVKKGATGKRQQGGGLMSDAILVVEE